MMVTANNRLQAALAAGTNPDPGLVDGLIEQCAVEPDFYVRDMLTWALTRHPAVVTVPRLVAQLADERPQARSQALHTLSKIGDTGAWPAITRAVLTDPDDEVARAGWRAAVALVPDGEEFDLALVLAGQLGRGGRETQLSLSRALVELGEVMLPAIQQAEGKAGQHAIATERLLRDPEASFEFAIGEATRIVAMSQEG